MAFSIRDHRLWRDDSRVETMLSPFIGGSFAEPPRILVVHFTAGASARSSAEWFRDRSNPGSSAHLVIERDGSVVQCVPFDTIAWHAGRSAWNGLIGLNRHALGIELANRGDLVRRGEGWASLTGAVVVDPVVAVHRNGNPDGSHRPIGWERYPDPQVAALAEIARALVATYGIAEIVGHDDIAPTRKWDPGPAFDMPRFRAAVFGGRGEDESPALTVRPSDGLNLRAGPGVDRAVLELLPPGTRVMPLERFGRWLSVSVLGADGAPRRTGWVHGAYLA